MLNGKTAVITGASRGIGAAVAEKFAHLGANVAIIYQANTDKAEDVCRRARDLGAEAEIYKCDVSDFDECKKTVTEVIGRFGKIDILVNNAGITRDNLIAMMSEDDFNKVVGTKRRYPPFSGLLARATTPRQRRESLPSQRRRQGSSQRRIFV